ncbi:Methionine aminopeptidase 2 [Chytriomyces hyalinus]|nr:Methionine aminopeptidase 2 [Chytriomyces hyalinus]
MTVSKVLEAVSSLSLANAAAPAPAATNPVEADGDEDEDDDENDENSPDAKSGDKKKKKKKKSKKKKAASLADTPSVKKTDFVQTAPPSIPVSHQFNGVYPVGQIMEYTHVDNTYRTTSEEKRAMERASFDEYNEVRQAAEVHR